MKGRESGMPEEDYWQTFFDADCIVERLGCVRTGQEAVVEFGSGYGTFTLPVARRTHGLVVALEIEPDLVELVGAKARHEGLTNIRPERRDFVEHGTGLPDGWADHAMLYNILHIEQPVALLREALRVLRPGGVVSVIHWRRDIATPRGPSLEIRPRPVDCLRWADAAGLVFVGEEDLSVCCPYHYGLLFQRPLR